MSRFYKWLLDSELFKSYHRDITNTKTTRQTFIQCWINSSSTPICCEAGSSVFHESVQIKKLEHISGPNVHIVDCRAWQK